MDCGAGGAVHRHDCLCRQESLGESGAARLRSFGGARDYGGSGGLVSGARSRGELRGLLLWFFLFAAASVFVSHGHDIGINRSGMKVCVERTEYKS